MSVHVDRLLRENFRWHMVFFVHVWGWHAITLQNPVIIFPSSQTLQSFSLVLDEQVHQIKGQRYSMNSKSHNPSSDKKKKHAPFTVGLLPNTWFNKSMNPSETFSDFTHNSNFGSSIPAPICHLMTVTTQLQCEMCEFQAWNNFEHWSMFHIQSFLMQCHQWWGHCLYWSSAFSSSTFVILLVFPYVCKLYLFCSMHSVEPGLYTNFQHH